MRLSQKALLELRNRLKVGTRRGVHLNAIPLRSRYKLDISDLRYFDSNIPDLLIRELLLKPELNFNIKISDKEKFEYLERAKMIRTFSSIMNEAKTIESEKGINSFGIGFPILIRRDRTDSKLTVAPLLIWPLVVKRNKVLDFEISRDEECNVYINEVLMNHIKSDCNIDLKSLIAEDLSDDFINQESVNKLCEKVLNILNNTDDTEISLNSISPIKSRALYEEQTKDNWDSKIECAGLFSVFEVQKQSIIEDYKYLIDEGELVIESSDLGSNYFQSLTSVETDPTQQAVLNSLESKRNILIQGPPGTGKSQTILAIILNALQSHKKTLVVCEKRTALEVLHKSLTRKGLTHHCVLLLDAVKDRRAVVDSVRERLELKSDRLPHYQFTKENLDDAISAASNIISSINAGHIKLDEKILGNYNWSFLVGRFLNSVKKQQISDFTISSDTFAYTQSEYHELERIIRKGEKLYSKFKQISDFVFLKKTKFQNDNPHQLEVSLNRNFKTYKDYLNEIVLLRENFRQEYFTFHREQLLSKIHTVENYITNIKNSQRRLCDCVGLEKQNYIKQRKEFHTIEKIKIERFFSMIDSCLKESQNWETDVTGKAIGFNMLAIFSKSKREVLKNQKQLKVYFLDLTNELSDSENWNTVKFTDDIQTSIEKYQEFKLKYFDFGRTIEEKAQDEYSSVGFTEILRIGEEIAFQSIDMQINNMAIADTAKNTLRICLSNLKPTINEFNIFSSQLNHFINEFSEYHLYFKNDNQHIPDLEVIDENLKLLPIYFDGKLNADFQNMPISHDIQVKKELYPSFKPLWEKFENLYARVQQDGWIKEDIKIESLDKFINWIESNIERKVALYDNNYITDAFSIEYEWYVFFDNLNIFHKTIIEELQRLSDGDWLNTFMSFYLNSILEQLVSKEHPINDNKYVELESIQNIISEKQIEYIKRYWFYRQLDKKASFEARSSSGLLIQNLYNKKSSSNFKRLSLRKIIEKDIDLFTTFFPVIFTTPDVASNLFKGNNRYFDFIIFDEASQLRLEDNIPSLLKGKQVVIAGDEHQMPPSNYFNRKYDLEDEAFEDEYDYSDDLIIEDDILSCESLLELAKQLSFKEVNLEYHYRSKHPYLIDFSNYAFYQGRLKPLSISSGEPPIEYINVNGSFIDSVNEAEAETVVNIIEHLITRNNEGRYPTLGVATFNIYQRDLIIKLLNERRVNPDFDSKMEELERDGLFVKNLENIQGDERDIIIISTTYGVNEDGKFSQKFGDINSPKGYRLLNVIVTRAKSKVYCCSSVPEDIITNYSNELREVGNNKKGIFYAYLAYAKSVSTANEDMRRSILTTLERYSNIRDNQMLNLGVLESPFEDEVYSYLLDYFDEGKFILQEKVAGYRIDMVYKPSIPNIPPIAIECDGAKYHSSREAYLYDRHRQKVLESYGYTFHRIWSTNWWKNPKREIKILVDFINSHEQKYLSVQC
ncbi:DUF4011 domain-containing protein [Emticicia sp. ODNR4P]|nr:DUF4011 domain-containing protein [Emticicia sp. ODNR4P]